MLGLKISANAIRAFAQLLPPCFQPKLYRGWSKGGVGKVSNGIFWTQPLFTNLIHIQYIQSNLISFQWFCFTENYAFCIELSPLQVAIMGLELCQRNLPKSISTEHPAPPFCTADPTRTKYRNSSHNHNLFFWQHPSYIFISPRRGLDRQTVWLNLMWHPRLLSS